MINFLPVDSTQKLDQLMTGLLNLKREVNVPTFNLNQLIILLSVYKHSPVDFGDLRRMYLFSGAGLSRAIDSITILGLVRRERAAYDSRKVILYMTEKGIDIIEKLVMVDDRIKGF